MNRIAWLLVLASVFVYSCVNLRVPEDVQNSPDVSDIGVEAMTNDIQDAGVDALVADVMDIASEDVSPRMDDGGPLPDEDVLAPSDEDVSPPPSEDVLPACPTGQTRCAGVCVDTNFSNDHCGGCGRPCDTGRTGRVCRVGYCVVPTGRLALGARYTCALLSGSGSCPGGVYCWGSNEYCETGPGTRPGAGGRDGGACTHPGVCDAGGTECFGTHVASRVPFTGTVLQISAGERHSCALVGESGGYRGDVYCWGQNSRGQLGDGSSTGLDGGTLVGRAEAVRVQVPTSPATRFIQVSAGRYHTCALAESGDVWCWGDGTSGQTGRDGVDASSVAPVPVMMLSGVSQIASGDQSTCVLRNTGRVVCWGDNIEGELGFPMSSGHGGINRREANIPSSAGPIVQVGTSVNHACALTAAGSVYCWGDNEHCHLGRMTSAHSPNEPAAVTGLTGARQIALNASPSQHVCALRGDAGQIDCFGHNYSAQFGRPNTPVPCFPGATEGAFGMLVSGPALGLRTGTIQEVGVGSGRTCVLFSDDQVWCWGNGPQGSAGRTDWGADGMPMRVSVCGM